MTTHESILDHRRRRPSASELVVRWTIPVLALAAVAMLPWTFWLSYSLPERHVSEHYGLAWTGFDLFLAGAIGATALALIRRHDMVRTTAAISGALLLCDAWFDVLSADSGRELTQALVLAFACELPLAALCFFISHRCELFYAHADSLRRRAKRAVAS